MKFKADAVPVFHKARPVPFALRDDLVKGYEEGIAKGIWKPAQFNEYGTPVVPIRKAYTSGSLKPKLQVCGDYSVGINDQLEDHRRPVPLPEELTQKLGGGFGYSKIDLGDVYNQIHLALVRKSTQTSPHYSPWGTPAATTSFRNQVSTWLLSGDHGEPDQ